MTRHEALKELLAKVEAGECPTIYGRSDPCQMGQSRRHITPAFSGSLDAAKALHDAVLPGWTLTTMFQMRHPDNGQHPNGKWEVGLIGIFPGKVRHAYTTRDDPARAWLIAIIKALIAQEEAQ